MSALVAIKWVFFICIVHSFDWYLLVIPGILLDKLSYFKQAESNEKAQKEQTADTLKEESKLQGQYNVGYPNGDNDYCHNDHGNG